MRSGRELQEPESAWPCRPDMGTSTLPSGRTPRHQLPGTEKGAVHRVCWGFARISSGLTRDLLAAAEAGAVLTDSSVLPSSAGAQRWPNPPLKRQHMLVEEMRRSCSSRLGLDGEKAWILPKTADVPLQ